MSITDGWSSKLFWVHLLRDLYNITCLDSWKYLLEGKISILLSVDLVGE